MNTLPLSILRRTVGDLKKMMDSMPREAGLEAGFKYATALHILKVSSSFITLAGQQDHYSARLLVRPIVESFLKLAAVQGEPEIFYRIAMADIADELRVMNAFGPDGSAKDNEDVVLDYMKNFDLVYRAEFPDQNPTLPASIKQAAFPISALAKPSGVEDLYETYYRLYCQHNHGNFRAILGGLEINGEPEFLNVLVAAACLNAMKALVSLGGDEAKLDQSVANVRRAIRKKRDPI